MTGRPTRDRSPAPAAAPPAGCGFAPRMQALLTDAALEATRRRRGKALRPVRRPLHFDAPRGPDELRAQLAALASLEEPIGGLAVTCGERCSTGHLPARAACGPGAQLAAMAFAQRWAAPAMPRPEWAPVFAAALREHGGGGGDHVTALDLAAAPGRPAAAACLLCGLPFGPRERLRAAVGAPAFPRRDPPPHEYHPRCAAWLHRAGAPACLCALDAPHRRCCFGGGRPRPGVHADAVRDRCAAPAP